VYLMCLPCLLVQEVELAGNGSVIVREFLKGKGGAAGMWVESSCGTDSLPQSISAIVSGLVTERSVRKRKYRLEAVLSIIRDDMDRASPEVLRLVESGPLGHLVLHARITSDFKIQMIEEQIRQLENVVATGSSESSLLGPLDSTWAERLESARERLASLRTDKSDDAWALVNGFIVSNATLEDATNFSIPYKEPSLVIYSAIVDDNQHRTPSQIDTLTIPPEVMKTVSLTNGSKSPLAANQMPSNLPGRGDMVAFDAEFVSLQEEEATLTEAGSKVVVRETRYAVARISLIDCRTGTVVLDDHVLPRERVVDCLTRFSGIVPKDLDPKASSHHLISTRAAYLKLRHLVERGCIFVGHGLLQGTFLILGQGLLLLCR
jgi:Exonuclease